MPIKEQITEFVVQYGFQFAGAIIILAVGLGIARVTGRFTERRLERFALEPPVRMLMVRLVYLLVMGLTLILVVSKIGVDIAPLVAALGVAGVGIGLAMQGVLANVAAGLTIIFTKPFRVGEYIELIGVEGVVQRIELFTTTLSHYDRSLVVIPNRKIVGEVLHNYGAIRQLHLQVGVAYDTDLARLERVAREILARNPRVLREPAPLLGITQLADSSINLSLAPWVKVTDFVVTPPELYRAVMDEFRTHQIKIPFPQREVLVLNQNGASLARGSTAVAPLVNT